MQNIKGNTGLALLLIRLAVGGVFLAHGVAKLLSLDMTISFFGSLGLPAFMAYLIAAVETLGGLAVLLGVGVQTASLLLALVMVGAIYTVKGKMGFLGGYEFDLTLLLAALSLSISGPGRYTIKRLFNKNQ